MVVVSLLQRWMFSLWFVHRASMLMRYHASSSKSRLPRWHVSPRPLWSLQQSCCNRNFPLSLRHRTLPPLTDCKMSPGWVHSGLVSLSTQREGPGRVMKGEKEVNKCSWLLFFFCLWAVISLALRVQSSPEARSAFSSLSFASFKSLYLNLEKEWKRGGGSTC